jgi:hypothetical protein
MALDDTMPNRLRDNKRFRGLRLILDRLIEVTIVFASVYAAFLLNGYQNRQQEDQRRDQLLAYLEQDSDSRARGLQHMANNYDRDAKNFLDQLARGEMPPIEPGAWATNFTGTEAGELLQAGALDLLSIETVAQMLDVDALARSGLAMMTHHERLDDQMITPHAGEDRSYFYDPTTHQLRPQFQRFVKELNDGSRFLHTLTEARDKLAAQVRVERKEFLSRKTSIFSR